jgi:hypothetical protein
MKTMLKKDLIMIASSFYHETRPAVKMTPGFLKYVNQRSLAVVMFIALALLASAGNKQSDSQKPSVSDSSSIPSSRNYDAVLMLNPSPLANNIVRHFEDALNELSLSEYTRQQRIDVSDSLATPCPNTSEPMSIVRKSLSSQTSKPLSNY